MQIRIVKEESAYFVEVVGNDFFYAQSKTIESALENLVDVIKNIREL